MVCQLNGLKFHGFSRVLGEFGSQDQHIFDQWFIYMQIFVNRIAQEMYDLGPSNLKWRLFLGWNEYTNCLFLIHQFIRLYVDPNQILAIAKSSETWNLVYIMITRKIWSGLFACSVVIEQFIVIALSQKKKSNMSIWNLICTLHMS